MSEHDRRWGVDGSILAGCNYLTAPYRGVETTVKVEEPGESIKNSETRYFMEKVGGGQCPHLPPPVFDAFG